jgi:hypothetical protein
MTLARSSQVGEQRWVLRPEASRPVHVRGMSGALVYGVSRVRDDGCVDVVLGDATRVSVHPSEIVAE